MTDVSAEVIADRYVLLRPLAEGGMGQVFLARQQGLDGFEKLVVIKRILPQFAAEADFARLFLDEARTAADLRHANVVTVFEVGVDRGALFLAMEYLDGQTIRRVLQQSVSTGIAIPLGVAVQIAIDVARGLDYAHKKTDLRGRPLHIVHRDVSPSNAVITWGGATKLLDFGVAKAVNKRERTTPGAMVGKIDYMAPEQVGGEEVDARSDQFALGILLWEMITRKRLFHGSDYEILRSISERPVPPPSSVIAGLAPELDAILLKALARKPVDRFADCAQLADVLEDWLAAASIPHSHGRVAGFLKALFGSDAADEQPVALQYEPTIPPVTPSKAGTELSGTLPGAVPAALTMAVRGNLPAEAGSFVGRVADLDALAEDFRRGERLVTLLGPGGAGKTRLALRYASRHLAGPPVPTGGAWFCDLTEARTLQGVAGTVAAALGIPLVGDAAGSAERLGVAIAGRGPLLLVLDNFEQAVEHAPATVGRWMAAAPDARFLVTSRELLRLDGEVAHEVENLSEPEAVQLFLERAKAVRRGWTPSADETPIVAEIVRRLDLMPLAIELAAARMTTFGPARLREMLSKRFELLAGARRSATSRQSTLRGAIDWSWGMLKPWEQAALAQASIFRGGFTVEAAERVIDLAFVPDAPWVVDVLQSLREKSLLRATEVAGGDLRFGMYESIREYAAGRLDETKGERHAVEVRHAEFYLHEGEQLAAGMEAHGGTERMRRLMPEVDNVESIHRRAIGATPPDAASALRAACVLEPVFVLRGPLGVLLSMLDSAISVAPPNVDPGLLVKALQARGGARAISGSAGEGIADLERAIAIARESGKIELLARLHGDLGRARLAAGKMAEAATSLDESIALAGSDPGALGFARACRAMCHHFQGRFQEARAAYEEALEHLAKTGNRRLGTKVLGNLGLVHESLGDFERAQALFEQSLASGRALNDQRHEGIVLGYLGVLHQEKGRFAEARRHYEDAIVKLREVGDRNSEAESTGYLGVLLHEEGNMMQAQERYERAVDVFRATGAKHLEGLYSSFLGALHAVAGRLDQARASFRVAAAALGPIGGHLLRAARINRGHLDLAMAASLAKEPDRAERWLARAQRRIEENARPESGQALASDEVRLAARLLMHELREAEGASARVR